MHIQSQSSDSVIEAWRLRRAEMRESMSALEQALAAPAVGRRAAWGERVHVASSKSPATFASTSPSPKGRVGSTAE